jgi:hypothetical protein
LSPGDVDLQHGDLPDPVGRALDLIVMRIRTLETEVRALRKAAGMAGDDAVYLGDDEAGEHIG